MEIRNEYTSFNSKKYHDHTHHITKCLHEERPVKSEAAAQGAGSGSGTAAGKNVELSRDGDIYHMNASYAAGRRQTGKSKSLLKGFWDALGEEGGTEGKGHGTMTAFKENLLSGIYGAADALKASFTRRIAVGINRIQERIRTGTQGGRRYFRRSRDAFAALADGRASSNKEQKDRRRIRQEPLKDQAFSTKGQRESAEKILVNSHLTDSYSKKGEYCQLGENLTYNKKAGKGRESAARP